MKDYQVALDIISDNKLSADYDLTIRKAIKDIQELVNKFEKIKKVVNLKSNESNTIEIIKDIING